MKQETMQKALEKIHAKKREAIFAYNKKILPLYEDKEYVELEKQYTRLMIENAKKSTLGDYVDKKTEQELSSKLDAIRKKYNLQNIKPNFSCQECNDEGIINGTLCKCLKKEISSMLLKDSGFEKLENFDDSIKTSGNLSQLYKKMKEWCNSCSNKTLIYIAGPTGVGKTHLMQCMANEFIENGRVVKISTSFKMNQDFKTFSKSYNEEILNKYLEPEILFIDDLGTEPLYKNITLEYFYLVINERKLRKLPTIITGNLTMEDIINRYDERICSRIADRQTSINIYLDGQDKRINRQ